MYSTSKAAASRELQQAQEAKVRALARMLRAQAALIARAAATARREPRDGGENATVKPADCADGALLEGQSGRLQGVVQRVEAQRDTIKARPGAASGAMMTSTLHGAAGSGPALWAARMN